jgi:hypothetical protein
VKRPGPTCWTFRTPAPRLAAVAPIFRARCLAWRESPDAPHLVPVLADMAIEWAARQWPPAGLFAGGSMAGRR